MSWTPTAHERDTVPLANYVRWLTRNGWIVLVATALGGLLGFGWAVVRPPVYAASVTVLAPAVPLHVGTSHDGEDEEQRPRDATVDTDAHLVHTEEVLSRLGSLPGFQGDRDDLRSRVKLTVAANTRVITISVQAPSPARSRVGAEVTAEAYLTLRQEILGGIQQRNREALQRRERILLERLKALSSGEDVLSRNVVRNREQAVTKQIADVRKELAGLDGLSVQAGEIIRDAQTPGRPQDRRRDVWLSNGAGVGLALGLAGSVITARRPRRIRSAAVVRAGTSIPIVAEIERVDELSDVCRRLRNLVFMAGTRTVFVAGLPASAAEPLARELARLCVSGGRKTTLLLVGDSGTRIGGLPYAERIMPTEDGDRGLARSLARAHADSGTVVVTGPLLARADAVTLATLCALVVVVAERGTARDLELLAGAEALAAVSTELHGIILTSRLISNSAQNGPNKAQALASKD